LRDRVRGQESEKEDQRREKQGNIILNAPCPQIQPNNSGKRIGFIPFVPTFNQAKTTVVPLIRFYFPWFHLPVLQKY
jgi:hypothetical protein